MNATLKSLLTLILLLLSLSHLFSHGGVGDGTQEATVLFDLEECLSIIPGETSRDYSEFTGVVSPQSFADISVVGGHLYRNDAINNPHSCTPGVFEGTQGMCVSVRRTCDYQPLTNKSVNFDITVVPLGEEPVRLTKLNFYELAPEMFTFVNGESGINGYPTLYGVRVLRDGREIFRSTENPTTQGWSLESFVFEESEDFTVEEPATFTFMLLGYCAVSNLPEFKVWDLDDISVVFEGPEQPNGGVLTGGPFEFCQDDQPDFVSGLTLADNVGDNSIWLISDQSGVIIAQTNDPTTIDFNQFNIGECFISHLSFTGGLTGLNVGSNIADLQGCFGFSNFISVRRLAVEAGMLAGGPYTFCVDDVPDFVQDVVLSGQSGGTGVWVVTDENRNIIALPASPEVFDFDSVGAGVCSLWNLSFIGSISGIQIGGNLDNIMGCFDLSNAIIVERLLSGDVCIDPTMDMDTMTMDMDTMTMDMDTMTMDMDTMTMDMDTMTMDMDTMTMDMDTMTMDMDTMTMDMDTMMMDMDTMTMDMDTMTMDMDTMTMDMDTMTMDMDTMTMDMDTMTMDMDTMTMDMDTMTMDMDTMTMDMDTMTMDMDTMTMDMDTMTMDMDTMTMDMDTIVMDMDTMTMDMDTMTMDMDTMTMDMDTMTMDMDTMMMDMDTMTMDTMTAIALGGLLSVAGDSLVVVNTCSGDEISDLLDVDLVGAVGDSSIWLITDVAGVILDLPAAPPFELDTLTFDTCLILNLSFNGVISGVEIDSMITDIQGDFDLSNTITVFKTVVDGGNISGGPFSFCVEDGLTDQVPNLMLGDNVGTISQWVITDTAFNIVALPDEITIFDFDIFAPGEYRVFNLSGTDSLVGLQNGSIVNDISGCFDISNSITVLSQNSGEVCDTLVVTSNGGVIATADADDVAEPLCAGDGIADEIDFTLTDNIGMSSVWIITDDQNIITELPGDPPFDFEEFGEGVSRVWHLSSNGGISGLGFGLPLSGLGGDFDLSNSITVNHLGVDGGSIEGLGFDFCIDGVSDIIPELIISDTIGPNIELFINNLNGFIVALPDDISEVDFDALPPGDLFINVISYIDTSTRVRIGDSRVNFEGCFDLSNTIVVDRASPDGGVLVGDDMAFCVDGESDFPVGISVSESSGPNDSWIITDEQGNIIDLPLDIDSVDFEVLGVGTCLIYNVSFEDGLDGLDISSSIFDLMGCFDLSDSIMVSKNVVIGGDISGGPFEFCIDNAPDFVSDITRSNNFGDSTLWAVTDADSIVLAIIEDITTFDFNVDTSQNFIFSVTFSAPTDMIAEGMRVDLLEGCVDVSNAIAVNKRSTGIGCNDGEGIAVLNEINENFVEIRNIGDSPIDISEYWLCQSGIYERIGELSFDCTDDFVIESGEFITVEMDEIEIDGIDGELALYTVDSFESSNAIIDYVEWGSINHTRANVAIAADIWSNNTVAESFVGEVSLSYDGSGDLGTDWSVNSVSPCGDNLETSVLPDWEIHGNPATQFIMVQVNQVGQLNVAEMEIHSIHGDLIKRYSQSLTQQNNSVRIDVSDLPGGMYLLVMRGQTTKQIERFIKQ